ncbi:hypothetical protein IMSAGC007_03061 [Lachnospiraceae bacterium]|nr:hypothetical protein IMSAGC007_03061 [Lachnospiraceae bacterium]
MNITLDEFIVDIAYKLNNEQVSFFTGSGVSTELGLPDWKNLFADIARKLSLDINTISDYYQLSQYYCNKYSAGDLKSIISQKLRTAKYDSPTINKLLRLGFKSIWTTNFDTAIENCLLSNHMIYTKVHSDKDLSYITPNSVPVIYKINGDIDDLENAILTQQDWENFQYTRPTMLTFMKKELVTNSFLFIGYSFRDNLIKSALSGIRQFVGNSGNHHYAIFEKRNEEEFNYFIDDLDKNYNVKAVLVDSYDLIPDILDKIYNKSIEKNIFISGRLDDYSDKTELFANNLLQNIAVKLLESEYNLCTGMGRKIGYFVSGPAIQYLLSKGISNIDKRIQIRPFDDNGTPEDFTNYRKYLISRNNILIFVFGQKFVNGNSADSKGVLEEYELAEKMGKKIIPIGSTGFAAQRILEKVNENITKYPYLEGYIDLLMKETDVNKISNAVSAIVQSIAN